MKRVHFRRCRRARVGARQRRPTFRPGRSCRNVNVVVGCSLTRKLKGVPPVGALCGKLAGAEPRGHVLWDWLTEDRTGGVVSPVPPPPPPPPPGGAETPVMRATFFAVS